jgi:hypothetical protein
MKKSLLAAIIAPLSLITSSHATDVTTYHNNQLASGVNDTETVLNLDNVNQFDFGLKYSVYVQGQIYAQPLFKSKVGTPARDLAFVVTQHNVVMAVDVSTGSPFWTITLNEFGTSVPSGDTGSGDLTPEIGIVSTPVISGNNIYVLSKSKRYDLNNTPHYCQTIYKIDIRTGAVIARNNFADTAFDGSNYTYRIAGPKADPYVLGSGDGSISVIAHNRAENRVYFNALRQMNRAALSLVDGVIYAGFASHGDNGPYHGWVIGFADTNLKVAAVLNTTPNGGLGGIWQSGGRIASDDKNNLYLETGNGSFDPTQLDTKGFPLDGNYGDCFIKLSKDDSTTSRQNRNGWGVRVVDYFTPTNNNSINAADLDLGSCGPLVVPSGSKTFIIGTGKDGSIYSMNAANMGKFDPVSNHNLQTINQALCIQGDTGNQWTAFCTGCYFNNRLFYFGGGDRGKQFTLNNGVIGGWFLDDNGQVQTDVETANTFAWPGANSSISANGNNSVINWVIDRDASILRAFRASDLLEVWNSSQASGDNFSGAIKFSVPVAANGNVFVGADSSLYIYGLNPSQRH